uniref:BTB domain-containing protein n=1 Tax=Oryza punctata TaxID=4537 RepID=A0A0E0M522_ORYPU
MSGGEIGGLRRVVRPQTQYKALMEEQDEERSRLLSKMDAFYVEACGRLGVRGRVVTLARLFDAGLCFGLLDPVSNIVVNTLATTDIRPDDGSKAAAAAVPLPSLEDKLPELGRRSLDGLSGFLLYFFPYLAAWEAVRYLLRADADLLVAARLVVADRGMTNFSITSATSVLALEGALSLAARLASHPDPHRLLRIWVSLSTRLPQALNMISEVQGYCPHDTITYRLRDWLLQKSPAEAPSSPSPPAALDLMQSWDLAAARLGGNSITDDMFSYKHLRSLRMMLLNTVHVFYLRALARLPRNELRHRYHRSLHMAGSCYGPLDPVSNIILNTIWYDVNFPAAELPVLHMVGPLSLNRVESRSFFGLLSFLQTRYTSLSEHEILQCLAASNADLSSADPKLNAAGAGEDQHQQQRYHHSGYLASTNLPGLCSAIRKVEQQTPCTSAQEAYEAAAIAAWHPKPEAQALFLNSLHTVLDGPALAMLQSRDCLTSEDVCYIADLLSPKYPPVPEQISKDLYPVIAGKMRSEAQHERICRKVKVALDTSLLHNGEPMYELHIICGLNEFVCGPEYCNDKADALSFSPCKYRYTHVNFLATRKNFPSAGRGPILLFAEFSNEEDDAPLLCCHVDVPTPFAEHVRCLYCEAQGARIVHPCLEKFQGEEKFEEVIRGERYFTNNHLICKSEYFVQSLGGNEEDFFQVPTSPIQAELIVLQMAMEIAAFIHWTELVFLTDNFQLADAMQKETLFLQDPRHWDGEFSVKTAYSLLRAMKTWSVVGSMQLLHVPCNARGMPDGGQPATSRLAFGSGLPPSVRATLNPVPTSSTPAPTHIWYGHGFLAVWASPAQCLQKTYCPDGAWCARVILVTWLVWKERNARVFHGKATLAQHLCAAIIEEWETWKAAELSCLLSNIQAFYRDACVRLAVDHAGGGGICVGLLDPVSNIVANMLLSDEVATVEELARRSLDGLVAFLLYFFPYLADWDAVRYLLLADADLLVAVRLIVASRGMTAFCINSAASAEAFQPALRLATQVAGHPQPERLVRVWMSLSSRLHQAVTVLSAEQPNLQGIQTLLTADEEPPPSPDLEQSWSLAASRQAAYHNITAAPCQHTSSLMRVLLHAFRGFYLRALARLPAGELRTRYHQVIVKAGHCYGPMDPVSNIILNTVWYHAAFPAAAAPPVLDMIGPNILTRIESRSFYGFVSFLQSRYHHLSEHDILQCLVAHCGDMSLADQAMVMKAEQQSPCAGVQEAYEAAATAAWHPNPAAQAAFLTSCKAKLQESPAAMSLLLEDGDRVLSPEDVRYLAGALLAEQKPSPQAVRKRSTWPVCDGKMRSMAQQRRISRNVKATLNQQFLQDGEPMYKLHVICGANESVCGPEYCSNSKEDYLSFAPCEYRYTHVNFLAMKKAGCSSSSPVLFFAEFDNKKAEGEPAVMCCKVDMPLPCAEHVRCLYCEVEGAKVVHPALETFHGGDKEFEEVILGKHSLTNSRIICLNEYAVQRLCAHDEDFMYVDVVASEFPIFSDDHH